MRVAHLFLTSSAVLVISFLGSAECNAKNNRPEDDFYYSYYQSSPAASKLQPYETKDYTDYSQHHTRTDTVDRGSSGSLPSGPYFSHESKDSGFTSQKDYEYDWYDGQDLHDNYPTKQSTYQQPYKRPSAAPPKKKKPIKRVSVLTYLRHRMKQRNPNHYQTLDKNSDFGTDKPLPDNFMGFMSVLAGVAYFLISKSATPVVKMRSGDESDDVKAFVTTDTPWPDLDFSTFLLKMDRLYKDQGIWNEECQKRSFCEIVYRYPQLASAARFAESALRFSMVQKLLGIGSSDILERREIRSLFEAAYDGEKRSDCALLYSTCKTSVQDVFKLYSN